MNSKDTLDVIKKLADTGNISDVCHKQAHNSPMPSIDVLSEIVNLIRSVLFPGYFGDARVNSKSMLYHIGVNIDRLQLLLQRQIKAGLCLNRLQKNKNAPKLNVCLKRKRICLFRNFLKLELNYILMLLQHTTAIQQPKAMAK